MGQKHETLTWDDMRGTLPRVIPSHERNAQYGNDEFRPTQLKRYSLSGVRGLSLPIRVPTNFEKLGRPVFQMLEGLETLKYIPG